MASYYSSIYTINFSKLAQRIVPWFWRKDILCSYLTVALSPLQTDNSEAMEYITDTWNKLSYTGQHLALEEFLNDNYDNADRRIYISENNIYATSIDMYKDGETDPSPIDFYKDGETIESSISLYLDSEIVDESGGGSYNFIVHIPSDVSYDENVLRKQLDYYVLADKNYNIVTF